MANDILKTLQAMEDELAAVRSAKEQVEAVVSADAAINSSLKDYASALSNLSTKLSEIKKSLERVATAVNIETDKFSASLNARKTDIESATNKLSDLLKDFKTHTEVSGIRTIAEKVKQLQVVYEGITKKLSELELKQQNTTTIISQSVDSVKVNIKKHTENTKDIISASIEKKASDIISSITALETEFKRSISTVDNSISFKSTEIFNKISAVESSTKFMINNAVADVKNIQDTSEQNIKSDISSTAKKQMWIGIIAILLVLIDIIIHFI